MALAPEDIPTLSYEELLRHLRLAKANAEEYSGLVSGLNEELLRRNPTNRYKCMKCGHEKYELHQFRAASGFWSAMFDLQSARYEVVTCARCKFSELYQGETGVGQQVADFMLGN